MPIDRRTLKTEDPIDTLKELLRLKLDPAVHKSCSMPGPDNLGCKHAEACPFAHKFKSRPRNKAVYRVSGTSGRSFVKNLPCYRLLDHYDEWIQNGDRVAIIGEEGDRVPLSGTQEKITGKDRNGRNISTVRPLRGKEDYQTVPPHPSARAMFPDRELDIEVQELMKQRRGLGSADAQIINGELSNERTIASFTMDEVGDRLDGEERGDAKPENPAL